ncbi:hypothetical protein AB3K78_02185 [Leucobacter sp. HNU]|uniref:hypothetical protein n=1 Tax=Leucobacter sp. HNU TaxID=3236805 RepID=UPI003A813179
MRESTERGRRGRAEEAGFPAAFADADVERIGILAARSVSVDRELRRTLAPRLAATHAVRRREIDDRAASALAARRGATALERPGPFGRILWGSLCVALAVALIGLASTFGPIKQLTSTRADIAWPIAVVAGIVALSAAALLHLLPPPRRGYPIFVAEVGTWTSSGLLALVLLYRASGLHLRETAYSSDQLRLWYACAGGAVLLAALLTMRWRRARAGLTPEEQQRGERRPQPPDAAGYVGALRTIVDARGGVPQTVRDDWRARLDREARRVAGTGTGVGPAGEEPGGILAALTAVDELDPVEVLARICADGGTDIERVMAALR